MKAKNIDNNKVSRRTFLKFAGMGAGATMLYSCGVKGTEKNDDQANKPVKPELTGKMTYRVNKNTDDTVSILGYGCMRLPTISGQSAQKSEDQIDQDKVNSQVDHCLEHGVNYFDTSPAYCKGKSEEAMGIALSRHPRDSYFIATKLSNFDNSTWPFEKSKEMFEKSLGYLQTDYIDYLLLHAVGMSAKDENGNELNGMEALHARYLDNGMLDWLEEQKKAGRIRNLGFSYHGDVEVFDYLLKEMDEGRRHWDFVQIQHNYVDWDMAKEVNPRNTNSEYLYDELVKRDIPVVVME
ncbi:MAG: aldo/keto reductase, partial [Muribaculaceae bacterium]|nr:aldo/keto reductase [Muribaculaceae bacterium]